MPAPRSAPIAAHVPRGPAPRRAAPGVAHLRRGLPVALLACAALATSATAGPLVCEIDRIHRSGLYDCAFQLTEDATLAIRSVAAGPDDEALLSYAWILDAASGEPVWVMTREESQRLRTGRQDRIFEGEITLAAGRYIAYFSALGRHYVSPKRVRLFDKLIGSLRTSSGFWAKWDAVGDPRRWGLRIEIADENADGSIVRRWDGESPDDDFLHFAPLSDGAHESAAFRVSRPVDARIRCVAEHYESADTYADRAWLAEALSRDVVWQTNEREAEPAGGAEKNHAFDVTLRLEPGDYVLTAITDDSHAWGSWNESPPFDPRAWGISLSIDDPDAVARIEDPKDDLLIARIERVEDSTYERRAFSLTHALPVRIEGLGELDYRYSDDRARLVDYGWLESLSDGHVVWSMEREKGEHAGGHYKNRIVSTTLELEPGTYMLAYVTDDSHAYGDWNTAPPSDPTAWGIQVYATSRDFDPSWVKPEDVREADTAIIGLAPTGDQTHRKQLMTLPRAFELRVICMGEGIDGRMYDYGWIEEAETGRKVWSMTFDEARQAGGAEKNLVVDETISLPPGRYVVHYVTDGSHSFEGWNDSPPYKPELWGISLYPVDTGPRLPR